MAPSEQAAVPSPVQVGSKIDETPMIEPETGQPAHTGAGLERPSLKRKDAPHSGNRFKVVSQLVVAMKRFQASLNPTYTYGKRASSSTSCGGTPSGSFRRPGNSRDEPAEEVSSPSLARAVSKSGEKGAAKVPRGFVDAHGNKTNLLFSPLPPHPSEVPQPGSAQQTRSAKRLVPGSSTANIAADAGS